MSTPTPALSPPPVTFVTVPPTEEPLRLIFASVVIIVLLEFCLNLAKHLNRGFTFSGPKPIPISLTIRPGKNLLPEPNQVKSYYGPGATSLLLLFCYFLIHFMIFVLFKRIDYSLSL